MSDPHWKDIVKEEKRHCAHIKRTFQGPVLGYVTPVSLKSSHWCIYTLPRCYLSFHNTITTASKERFRGFQVCPNTTLASPYVHWKSLTLQFFLAKLAVKRPFSFKDKHVRNVCVCVCLSVGRGGVCKNVFVAKMNSNIHKAEPDLAK